MRLGLGSRRLVNLLPLAQRTKTLTNYCSIDGKPTINSILETYKKKTIHEERGVSRYYRAPQAKWVVWADLEPVYHGPPR